MILIGQQKSCSAGVAAEISLGGFHKEALFENSKMVMCCSILVYPSIKSGLYFQSFYLVLAYSSVKTRMISRQKSRSIYTMFAVTTCARDSHVYTRQSLEAVTIRNVILISTQESVRFLVYMIRVRTRCNHILNVKIVNDLNSMNQGSYHIQSNIDTQQFN